MNYKLQNSEISWAGGFRKNGWPWADFTIRIWLWRSRKLLGIRFFYLWRVINVVDLWTIVVVVRELLGQTQRLLFGVSFAKLKQSNSCESCPNFSAQPKLVFSLTNIKYETMGTGAKRGRRKTFCPSWSHPFRNYVSPSNYYDDLSNDKPFLASVCISDICSSNKQCTYVPSPRNKSFTNLY